MVLWRDMATFRFFLCKNGSQNLSSFSIPIVDIFLTDTELTGSSGSNQPLEQLLVFMAIVDALMGSVGKPSWSCIMTMT